MSSFQYPDVDDHILQAFVEQKQPYIGYWLESERNALRKASDYLLEQLGPREQVRALDAGCGQGRMIPWIAKFSSHVLAADPDQERLARARRVKPTMDVGPTQLVFQNVPIDLISGGPFDLIICSHVIQHVSTLVARQILLSLRALAAPDCVAIIAFSRSKVGLETYGVSQMQAGEPDFELVDRATFDAAATGESDKGRLPVRMIDPAGFSKEAQAVGWKIEWSWTYHAANWSAGPVAPDHDDILNLSSARLNDCEGDVYVALRPIG